MLQINDLTDDCLRQIFSRLSLSCKLTLHRICPRWRSLQYSITCTHTSITLLIGSGSNSRALLANSCLKVPYLDQIKPHSSPFSEHSTLEMTKLSRNVTCQLKQLLPSVTSLQLCLNKCSEIGYVLVLLRFWSSSLKYLSLYNQNIRIDGVIPGFLEVLSQVDQHCLALDFLSVELHALRNCRRMRKSELPMIPYVLELACLVWLKEFRFYSSDVVEVVLHSLRQYASKSDRLERIAIGNQFTAYSHRNRVVNQQTFQTTPQLMSKFTLLSCVQSPSDCSRFTSLTTLSIKMASLSWTQFTTYLSPLKSLIHVKLTVIEDVLSQSDSTPSLELAQLPSIRIIQIGLRVETFHELQSRHWGWIFPSLHLLELELQGRVVETPSREVRAARLSQLLEPFKWQCDKLRRIVTLEKDYNVSYYQLERKVWDLVGCNNWNQVEN